MVMMWFLVHGSAFGETTGKPVGLVPYVVFVVPVLRRFLFFFPLLFRCTASAAAVRPAAKQAAAINLFGFPYGILLHQFFLSLGRVFFRFFLFFLVLFVAGFLFIVFCLSPPAAKSSSFTSGMAELASSSFSLSPVLSRSSVVFSFPSSASLLQGGVLGVREGSKTVLKNTSCLPLLLPLHRGDVYE